MHEQSIYFDASLPYTDNVISYSKLQSVTQKTIYCIELLKIDLAKFRFDAEPNNFTLGVNESIDSDLFNDRQTK